MDALRDAMKENFTPEAIALMVAHLQGAKSENGNAQRQVEMFSQFLVDLVGGHKAVNSLFEEIGV